MIQLNPEDLLRNNRGADQVFCMSLRTKASAKWLNVSGRHSVGKMLHHVRPCTNQNVVFGMKQDECFSGCCLCSPNQIKPKPTQSWWWWNGFLTAKLLINNNSGMHWIWLHGNFKISGALKNATCMRMIYTLCSWQETNVWKPGATPNPSWSMKDGSSWLWIWTLTPASKDVSSAGIQRMRDHSNTLQHFFFHQWIQTLGFMSLTFSLWGINTPTHC